MLMHFKSALLICVNTPPTPSPEGSQLQPVNKQIIVLKLPYPTETSSWHENYWWEDESEEDYFR